MKRAKEQPKMAQKVPNMAPKSLQVGPKSGQNLDGKRTESVVSIFSCQLILLVMQCYAMRLGGRADARAGGKIPLKSR